MHIYIVISIDRSIVKVSRRIDFFRLTSHYFSIFILSFSFSSSLSSSSWTTGRHVHETAYAISSSVFARLASISSLPMFAALDVVVVFDDFFAMLLLRRATFFFTITPAVTAFPACLAFLYSHIYINVICRSRLIIARETIGTKTSTTELTGNISDK